jgi:CTP:molybdopterin cytidylyltransferase MocA
METNLKSKIDPHITGLLLCAGMSGRMGTSKALMLYNGLPFAVQVIKKLLFVCEEVVVVVGHESEKVKSEILKCLTSGEAAKLQFVFNDNYIAGMFSSLQCGLGNIPQSDWILYHFVDQPSLPVSFYKEFVEQLSEAINWVQPSHKNRLGHPILFNKKVCAIILKQDKDSSLRKLSNNKRIKRKIWECRYAEILKDIDTMEEFDRLNLDS